jgi:heme A synthase
VIVLSYIVLALLLAAGLAKTKRFPAMTKFLFLFAIVFIASGFLTVLAANLLPGYAGLAERINLYSLMVSNIVLAFWVFSHGENERIPRIMGD